MVNCVLRGSLLCRASTLYIQCPASVMQPRFSDGQSQHYPTFFKDPLFCLKLPTSGTVTMQSRDLGMKHGQADHGSDRKKRNKKPYSMRVLAPSAGSPGSHGLLGGCVE